MIYHINKNNPKAAFTLSEVLITLGIIGVVAAMTIPALVNKYNDMHYKMLWKKAFSVISNAVENAVQEEALKPPQWPYNDAMLQPYSQEIYYNVFKRLNTKDFCVKGLTTDSDSTYCVLNGANLVHVPCQSLNPNENKPGCMYAADGGYAKLPDGMMVYAHSYMWVQPAFTVDVNGPKPPNTVGRDIFLILVRNDKAIPAGADGYKYKDCSKTAVSDEGAVGIRGLAGVDCSAEYLLE
ncbi:MAG: type II secretion system protein [Candidatus Gastranaerophilaceae bacterium]